MIISSLSPFHTNVPLCNVDTVDRIKQIDYFKHGDVYRLTRRKLELPKFLLIVPMLFFKDLTHRLKTNRCENWLLCKGQHVFCLICILCHNFWTNYDLDLLSTSKWPSGPQFYERFSWKWQKMTPNSQKMVIYES